MPRPEPAVSPPLSQRSQGWLRAVALGSSVFGGALALPFVIGGVRALVGGRDNGVPLIVIGLTCLTVAIVVPAWIVRRWGSALSTPVDPGVTLPFGATPRGSGAVVRPRAVVRVGPGVVVTLLLLAAWGMSLDDVSPVAVWSVLAVATGLTVAWWWFRRYELCLDAHGLWRRRWPRWRIAWTDVSRVEEVPTAKRPNAIRPDDLMVHGLLARPTGGIGGRTGDRIRLRMNLLAISPDDLSALAEFYAASTPGPERSGFETWS